VPRNRDELESRIKKGNIGRFDIMNKKVKDPGVMPGRARSPSQPRPIISDMMNLSLCTNNIPVNHYISYIPYNPNIPQIFKGVFP
jgi:hypothetical protein